MKFETPIAEVEMFELEDILTASSDPMYTEPTCPDEGPLDWR